MVIELGMGGPNKTTSQISLSHVVFFWSVQHTDCRSEDKTLRVNRDEEAEMSGNFEDNGLVKENGQKLITIWPTKSIIKWGTSTENEDAIFKGS